jgi:hypothetical protein
VADNAQILLSFGVDEASLKTAIKAMTGAIRTGLKAELDKKPLEFPKIDASMIKFKGAVNLSDLKLKGTVDIPVDKIRWTGGSLDLSTIPVKGAINVPVPSGAVGTGTGKDSGVGKTRSVTIPPEGLQNISLNSAQIDRTRASLVALQQALLAERATTQEVDAATKALAASMRLIENGYQKIQTAREARQLRGLSGDPTEAEVKQLAALQVQLEKTTQSIQTFDKAQVKSRTGLQAGLESLKNMAFSVGLVGYGLENLGRRMLGFSESLFGAVHHVAEATEQLERLKNALTYEGATKGERDTLLDEIKRISLLPGGRLKEVAESFQEIRTAGLGAADSLKLIEGLTKATTISGKGAAGVTQAVKVMRRALLAQENPFKTQTLDTLEAQVGPQIAEAILHAFGSVDAKTLNKAGGPQAVKAIIDELGKLGDALPVPLDIINHIEDSLLRMGDVLTEILMPSLTKLLDLLLSLEDIFDGLKEKFDGLSQPTKDFISGVLLAIPLIIAGLGAIFSFLGVIAVGIAVFAKAWKVIAPLFEGATAAIESAGAAATATEEAIVALGGEVAGVAETVAVTASGIARFIPVIGTVIALITAYAGNVGGFRDSINSALADVYDSFVKLEEAIVKVFNTKLVQAYVNYMKQVFADIGSLLTQATGLIGDALGLVIDQLSSVVDLISGIIEAFSADSFTGFLQKIGDAISMYLVKTMQRALALVLDFVERFYKFLGPIMVRFKVISQDTLDNVIQGVENFKKEWTDTNYTIINGEKVLKKHTEAVNSNAVAVKNSTETLKEQKQAFDALATAATKAADAIQKSQSKAAQSDLKAQIEEVKAGIKELADAYKDSLAKEFDPDKLDSMLKSIRQKIEAKRNQLINLENSLGQDESTEVLQDANVQDLISKSKIALDSIHSQDAATAKLALTNMEAAKSYAELNKYFREYGSLLQNLKKQFSLTDKQASDLNSLIDLMRSHGATASNQIRSRITSNDKDINSTLNSLKNSTEARHDQLVKGQENSQLQLETETLEGQIRKLQADNARLDVEVANFELTASRQRVLKAENDKKIAGLRNQIDVEKATKDLNILKRDTPGDALSIANKEREIAALGTQLAEITKGIDDAGDAAQAKASEKAVDDRLKRLKESSNAALDVIKPFEDTLFKLFGQTLTDGIDKTKGGILAISQSLKTLGSNIPEVAILAKQLEDFTEGKLGADGKPLSPTGIFERMLKMPAEHELESMLRESVQQLTAMVLSEFEYDEKGKVINGGQLSPLFASVLGVDPKTGDITGKTKDELKDAIENTVTTVDQLWSAAYGFDTLQKSGREDLAGEIETFAAMVLKASTANAELQKVTSTALEDTLNRIDKSLDTIFNDKLQGQISSIKAQIADIDEYNAEHGVMTDQKKKRDLLVQERIFEFQREDLDLQFRAREELREKKNSDRQAEIFKKLQEDRVAAFRAAEEQILEISGGDKGKLPDLKPINLPKGTNDPDTTPKPQTTKKKGGIFDIFKSDVGDLGKIDKFIDKINAVTAALKDAAQAGADVRSAVEGLVDYVSSGSLALDTWAGAMAGANSIADAFSATIATVVVDAFMALGDALISMLEGGDIASFSEFLGSMLMAIGEQLIQLSAAMVAYAFITEFFDAGGGLVGLIAGGIAAAAAAPMALMGAGVGALLILAGSAMGGKGKSSPSANASKTNSANAANAKTGATGDEFDANKDPKTIYQKQMKAEILIDIKTDDTQIVKTIVKHVNGNGRLATLIGNRKLQFGY